MTEQQRPDGAVADEQDIARLIAVQNLFDVQYFDYAVASPFPFGFASQLNTYNAYPQPGRVFMGRLGLKLP